MRNAVIVRAWIVSALVLACVTLGVSGQLVESRLAAATATAQSGVNFERPPTWRVRYDAESSDRKYEVMRPGWHVHPGEGALFWDPGRFASGNYSVASTIFLFPPGEGPPASSVDAPYGVFIGGRDLDGASPSYVTFLVANDGRFRVAHHTGDTLEPLVPWTAHEAIVRWTESTEGTAENALSIDVTEEAVTFWVNDTQVTSVPRAAVTDSGLIGIRAGKGLSLHVTDIAVGPNRR